MVGLPSKTRCITGHGRPWCSSSVGLGQRRADTRSGGQRQRVVIARALGQRLPVLLADEPVASLGPGGAEAILGPLCDLARREGLAALACLHRPDLARRFADQRLALGAAGLKPLHAPVSPAASWHSGVRNLADGQGSFYTRC